jgi:hypothetical protein
MRRAILAILPLLCACEGEAEKAVRSKMLDPEAAQFRDVERCTGDRDVWRGEVNGKNRLGAFVGFKPFFYSGYRVAFLEDYDFSGLMDRCYSDLKGAKGDATASATSAAAGTDDPSPAPASSRQAVAGGLTPNSDVDFPPDAFDERPGSPRCWADYCPCDTEDPDYGYLDISICRNLKMGVAVSDSEFSIGARSRDARKALREFNESETGYRRPSPIRAPAATSTPAADRQGAAPKRFPYVAPDGVDITNEEDERNWQKYGTTRPGQGE